MGQPLFVLIYHQPASSAVICGCTGFWLWLRSRRLGHEAVGLSYQRCVVERQWWRAVVAQLAHFDLLHILFNMTSLWAIAPMAEPPGVAGSSLAYLASSAVLLLGSAAVCLAACHILAVHLGREPARHTSMVGYSCVVFGHMAYIAFGPKGHGQSFSLLGLAGVPMWLAPVLSLALTQLIVPNASLVGHASGILVGLALATGWLDWLLSPYWTACMCIWAAIGICYNLVLEGRYNLPYIRLLRSGSDGSDELPLEVVVLGGRASQNTAPGAAQHGQGGAMVTAAAVAAGGAAELQASGGSGRSPQPPPPPPSHPALPWGVVSGRGGA